MDTTKPLSGAERMTQAEDRIAVALEQNQKLFDMVEQCMTVIKSYEDIMRTLIMVQSHGSAADRWERVKPLLDKLD